MTAAPIDAFDLQGHRGARGLAPENTLTAFARALEIGVTTLETDLAVTRDGVLVLSHDPVLNPDIVRGADGKWLSAPGPAINSLTFAELKRFDIGRLDPASKYARHFPAQRPADGERFPALAELFELVKRSGKPVRFNIETKLSPDKPAESPDAETFARLVVEAIRGAGLGGRATLQSFDWRSLLAAKKLAPEIETVCLTDPLDLARQGRWRRPRAFALARRARSGRPRRLRCAAGGSGRLRRLVAPIYRADAGAVAEAHGARPEGGALDGRRTR